MKRLLFILLMTGFSLSGFSQVGINTTNPNAQLDIKSSNQAAPSNTDGILIPKIDAFPAVNPTAAQEGMLVYLNMVSAGKQPGFYYWDDATTSWKGLGGDKGWDLPGNTVSDTTKFVGTINSTDLIFKSDNHRGGRIGSSNTSIGKHALNPITFGTDNSAFGKNALNATGSANGNSAMGADALFRTTNASFNTALGANAGASNTTGSNNIFVGANADAPSATASNQMSIGNVIYGADMNTTALGKIGIGAAVPAAKFHISASNSAFPSNTDGILIPRINDFPAVNPTVAQTGMMVYLTSASAGRLPGFYYWDAGWKGISANSGWGLTGNSGTSPTTNFIGTTDNADLIFKRQNVKSGSIGISLTSFGLSSLTSNTAGYQNVAFGNYVLADNDVGHDNAAFGFSALRMNKQGRLNTAVGGFALMDNINGNSNTGIGEQALTDNTSGSGNTSTGYQSMMKNITGENNTANGHIALLKNTLGSYNVAVGASALFNDGSGSNATAVGYEAMYNANSATGGYTNLNTAVGFQSLKGSGTPADNTGNNNTVLGYQGLLSNSKGESNIAVGPQALYNNSVSSKNIAIGDKALFTQSMVNGGIAFDAHNIAIGYEALYTTNPTRTTPSSETGIMNVAVGNYAMQNNTTGRSNTAFGTYALNASTVGGWNTAIGHRALAANTTASGNVALGMFSMISNTTGENNTALGSRTLYSNTSGNENVAVGYGVLERNRLGSGITAIGTRAMEFSNAPAGPNTNIAVGYEALRGQAAVNNTGFANTVIGYQSMTVNTTGSGNSALGDETLKKNTTGSFNNAFGMFSMFENTTGSQNNAHGSESLLNNTSGDNNSGFGYRTLSGNTVGSDNTAFGNAALLVNKTGNKNVAIGSSALAQQSFLNGNVAYDTNNVAVGYRSLYANNSTAATNGIQNTGVGNYSLESNTTGINNTSIGYRSGSNVTSGSNNIAIGANSVLQNATANNQMSIANVFFGEAMDNITTARFSIGAVPTAKDKLYVYSSQTTAPPNDDGQSAIYGYRTRTTQNDGSAYSRDGSNSAVKGFNLWGDQYSFGVSGFSYNDTTPGFYRSGGVLGAVWDGAYWASLGYRASSLVNYGIYATSALATGTGRMSAPSQQYTVGGGFYGGLIGSWSKGEIIGNVSSGKFFASYNSGDEYTTGKQIEIVETGNSKTAAYTVTSTDVVVYKKGKIALQNGTAHVAFDADYARLLGDAPIVTTTPMGQCNGIYIESVDKKGFTIKELNNGASNVSVSWIAVGDRIDSAKTASPSVLENDFDNNINEVMFNENDPGGKGKAAWSDGNKIKFGELPESLKEKNTKKEEL